MRFPGPPADGGEPGVGQESDRISAEDRELPLSAWFELQILTLEKASRTQGRPVDQWLPSPDLLQYAVESGSLKRSIDGHRGRFAVGLHGFGD